MTHPDPAHARLADALLVRFDVAGARKTDIELAHDAHHLFLKVVHCSIHDQGTVYSSHIERPAGTSARTVFVIRLR